MEALDQKKVAELLSLMGDDYPSVFNAFNESALKCLQQLSIAIEKLDIQNIERTSHTLKGSSANIGALQLSKLCDVIVSKARNADDDGYAELFDKVNKEYDKVRDAISKLLEK